MFVVIFRAKTQTLYAEYSEIAQDLRQLALTQFGCIEFHAVTEGQDEIALSYWPSEEHIRAWKQHADHLVAQRRGKADWYDSYTVQICEIKRQYQVDNLTTVKNN